MPRKIRQLIRDLERAGFSNREGKGSPRNDEHPKGQRVTLSGTEEGECEFFVARADATGTFEPTKAVFDVVALAIVFRRPKH